MIQVCSRCGTRWNVHERRRTWCPRCNGALWAPLAYAQEAELQWSRGGAAPPPAAGTGQRPAPRLAPGYRWIAVRPGPPPPPRRRRRPLGPTPHYTAIPRWGLIDRVNPSAALPKSPEWRGSSAKSVRKMLAITMTVLGIAALAQAVVYALLIINRSTLLHPVVAGAAVGLGALTSLAAIAAVISCAVVLTRWLIARRAAAVAQRHLPEDRSGWALWAGCLVPVVNLAWAPVYVIELATREDQFPRLRKPIVVWWLIWVLSTAVAIFATATSWAQDAQGIANNTVTMVVAYLLGLAAVAAAARLFEGFERRPVQRPAHRWVVVADGRNDSLKSQEAATPAAALESDGREPAA
ncbi:MAG: DUF4328 domain-containing protein [Mycobacterium sp.]